VTSCCLAMLLHTINIDTCGKNNQIVVMLASCHFVEAKTGCCVICVDLYLESS
jgi:hypothetical protein